MNESISSEFEWDFDLLWTHLTNLSIITLILGPLGIITNSGFLFTVAKQRSLRKMPLVKYLVNLSCVDLFFSAACTITTIVTHLVGKDPLLDRANWFNYMFHGVKFPFQIVCCILILLMTWDRYKAVSDPIKYSTKPHGTFKMCCTCTSLMVTMVFLCLLAIRLTDIADISRHSEFFGLVLFTSPTSCCSPAT